MIKSGIVIFKRMIVLIARIVILSKMTGADA